MLPSFVTISSLVAQVLIALCATILYIFCISHILPSVFLKPRYNATLDGDRGLKKYLFNGGRSIVYEPSVESKKYIKQYILTAVGEEKYIQCKFDFRVFSSRYDVFAFDCDGRMIDAIQIEEPILEKYKYISQPAMLPQNTAYVRVSVKAVNEVKIEREPTLEILPSQLACFTFITVLLTIVEAFIMKFVMQNISGLLFSYASKIEDQGNLFTLLLSIVVGLLISACGKTLHSLGKREKEDLNDRKNRLKKENRK